MIVFMYRSTISKEITLSNDFSVIFFLYLLKDTCMYKYNRPICILFFLFRFIFPVFGLSWICDYMYFRGGKIRRKEVVSKNIESPVKSRIISGNDAGLSEISNIYFLSSVKKIRCFFILKKICRGAS